MEFTVSGFDYTKHTELHSNFFLSYCADDSSEIRSFLPTLCLKLSAIDQMRPKSSPVEQIDRLRDRLSPSVLSSLRDLFGCNFRLDIGKRLMALLSVS